MKKRLLCLLVVTSVILTFSGCKNKKNNEVSSAPEAGLDIAEGESAEKEVVKVEDYSLEDIAALNGISVQELNYLTGYDGELLFVGGKYGEEKVTNYEEALASLDHLKTIAKLKRLNFEYNRTDVSPVTGNIIYTFYQTANTEIGSETMAAKFFNSLVKVITDKDGNLIGASCDITPSYEVERLDESDVITKGEAIEYVRNLINDKNRRIYEDVTEYAYWEDQGTVLSVNASSKISPAWFIYTDAAGGNNVEKPYEVFVVSLTPTYDTDENNNTLLVPAVIASFFVETLDPNDLTGVYTSLFYFDGMKDAGEYTYEIDMSWVKKYSEEYTGPDKVEYTVPVMYSEKEDLYYLGDADRKVTLSNYYDFQM
ncbi:MAG: hypothetical protein HUJ56_02240, partial [Erysipelotrichaceae bacterium]|nr:hypothetical protein [Erysipelotrichaceae bacterium]